VNTFLPIFLSFSLCGFFFRQARPFTPSRDDFFGVNAGGFLEWCPLLLSSPFTFVLPMHGYSVLVKRGWFFNLSPRTARAGPWEKSSNHDVNAFYGYFTLSLFPFPLIGDGR